MIYVLDSNSFGVLKNFYPKVFATFWDHFDALVSEGRVTSVREVRKELSRREDSPHLIEWIEANDGIFSGPSEEELDVISDIFAIKHFQQLIGKKQLLKGYPVADPFVVARACVSEGCVVTEERHKPNGAQIPNVCEHFGVDCISIEGMLSREGWAY